MKNTSAAEGACNRHRGRVGRPAASAAGGTPTGGGAPADLLPIDGAAPHLPEPWRTSYDAALHAGVAALALVTDELDRRCSDERRSSAGERDDVAEASAVCERWRERFVKAGCELWPTTRVERAAHAYLAAIATIQAVLDDYAAALAAGATGETRQ